MSARGARSRKAVAKDIEKKEKKAAVKGKAVDSVRRPHDAFAEWPPTSSLSSRNTSVPSRNATVSSNTSGTSRSSSTNPSHGRTFLNTIHSNESFDLKIKRRTSASGSASISETSTKGSQGKAKYQSKAGKETKAPRGRGGGVPVKRATAPSPAPILFRSETSASRHPPNQKTWIDFRIWEGGDSGLPPYGGFECDEHMQEGNVLVYFKEEQTSDDRPIPQIRCDLEVLENAGSTWLSNALLYGRIDDDEEEWTMSSSPESSVPQHSFPQPPGQSQRRMLGPSSPGGRSPPPFSIDQAYSNVDQAYFGVPPNRTASRVQYYADEPQNWPQSPPPNQHPQEIHPTHELWFTAPAHVRTPQGQRLHHVAIRNFLAMLHNKPIVGSELFEMLTTLQPEIQVMYDLDSDNQNRTPRERSVQMIVDYLQNRKLDDVRNSIKTALGLLAWSEQDNVKWRQGYLESFVHLAGVMSPHMEELADFKRLSIATRRNLAIASKSLQLRVMEAEEKLASFDFSSDLWSSDDAGKGGHIGGPVFQSYSAFRQFLVCFFERAYGEWPPSQSNSKTWLNRKMVLAMQKDFGALYDYLVNRDVIWDSQETRPGKKWAMINMKTEDFQVADTGDVSLTDMLVTFDNKYGFAHIPHPYPLLPREVPGGGLKKEKEGKKGFFSGLGKGRLGRKEKEKGDKEMGKRDEKEQLQLSIVFGDATNIEKMDGEFNGSTLIDAFEAFELSSPTSITPRESRLGRWILLYATLQVLSTLSVDTRELKWTKNVRYFLCTDLKRCPEWVTAGQLEYLEASQLRSWCWQRPWGRNNALNSTSGSPAELEGRELSASQRERWREGGGELEMDGRERDARERERERERSGVIGRERLNNDIQRISEKIDSMSTTSNNNSRRNYERKIENEKIKKEEFGITKRREADGRYKTGEEEYVQRPVVPLRSPLRSPTPSGMRQEQGFERSGNEGYEEERAGWL